MPMRRPEGGDFWETPLHSPNLLAAGHAANAIGYQITAVKLGLAIIPALGGVLAENLGVESIGPFLLAVSIVVFLLHEATLHTEVGA